ncbi:transporter [Kingella kingae]|uniref:transporter n=1 Tax=Kingella kingae TaxID=504 RepID=UPI0004016B5D|nr:transporter [Kingella kingae]
MPACVLAFLPTPKSHYTLASLLAFAIGYWLSVRRKCPHKLAALNGLAAGQANSGFVGYPLLSVASNANTASVYFPMNVLTENIVIMPLLLILLSWEKSHNHLGSGLKKIGKTILTNPIIIALLCALPFAFGWFTLPTFAQEPLPCYRQPPHRWLCLYL